MKQKGWKISVICWMLVLAFALALTGCATKHDLQRVEAIAQQALENSEAAMIATGEDAEKVLNAATRAENAAGRAEAAASTAEQSAMKAESMANKAEDIFMKQMQK